jgi:hypothetical protein
MTTILIDKNFNPTDKNIAQVLGNTINYWNSLWSQITSNYPNVTKQWKFYPDKAGWVLQVQKIKRTLFWLKPLDGYFSITFWYGDKAVDVVSKSDIPEKIKQDLKNSKNYTIGRSLTIEIKEHDDTKYIIDLINIKLKN